MAFYSHAIEKDDGTREGSKLLKAHLQEVGNVVNKLIARKPVHCLNIIPDAGYFIGIAHDFGKYTTFFQDYLLHDQEDSQSRHYHGFISAVFAAFLTKHLAQNNKYLPLVAYFVVLHHHGDLKALELDIVESKYLKEKDFISANSEWRCKLKVIQEQVRDIRQNLPSIEAEYRDLVKGSPTEDINIEDFSHSWSNTLSELHKLQYNLSEHENEEVRLRLFSSILFLYSLLIDSDKKDAADVSDIERKDIPDDLVDRYREENFDTKVTSGMDGIRNEIYEKVNEKISATSLSNHILTFTAPTGTGKTLASLSCALKLRARLEERDKVAPRIIYSLPFTSIIDQNYGVIRDVLGQLTDFNKNENVYLIKHHHLADLVYKADDENRPISESLLLIESWESEVIVTTFMQLLHTIIGFKNRFLKKYHNIAGAIILLDEVQNIPIEYWPLVNKVLKLLVEHFGCYIILLTATKPLIFDDYEAEPLLDDSEKYFKEKGVDRITLSAETKQPKLLDEFYREFQKLFDESKSYLIVFNTIKTSIIFYNTLNKDDTFNELFEKKYIFYLSTNIIPKERAERIEQIKELLEQGKKIVVISTQVVEAGVDVDLDVVIRDIGPIDSIVQVAGRCNRGMGDTKGKVYIFDLTDGHCSYSKYVYGSTHSIISHDLLDDKIIEEREFFNLINQYFSIVVQKKNQDKSNHIWEAIKAFRFHYPEMKSISDFELINERAGYIDVFVERDVAASGLLKQYIHGVIKEKNFRKRQNNYLSMRKDFKSYIVSIPTKLSAGLDNISEHLLKIPNNQLQVYYEDETGFKRIEDSSYMF